jgi:hypothetical protein
VEHSVPKREHLLNAAITKQNKTNKQIMLLDVTAATNAAMHKSVFG